MRLYFPVDLTDKLIMIEKLVLGEIWTGVLQIFDPDALTSAPSWHLPPSTALVPALFSGTPEKSGPAATWSLG